MTNREFWIERIKASKQLRKQIANPSENTLASWKIEDAHDEAFLELLERKEAKAGARAEAKSIEEDFPNVKFTSDIKVKK